MSCNRGTRSYINSLVWENGFTQVVDRPTQGDALLDVYLVRHGVSFSIVQYSTGDQGSSRRNTGI